MIALYEVQTFDYKEFNSKKVPSVDKITKTEYEVSIINLLNGNTLILESKI